MNTMDHDDAIPYYHTNIKENKERIFNVLNLIVDKYGVLRTSLLYPGEAYSSDNPFCESLVYEWKDDYLHRVYQVERFAGADAERYGSHVMWRTETTFGDEKEVYVDVFNLQTNEELVHTRHYQQRTTEDQREHDEWWEQNKVTNEEGLSWAIRPDTTDEIAYSFELMLETLNKAGFSVSDV